MVVTCISCNEGIGSDSNPCGVCGGDGEIDLTDPAFLKINWGVERMLRGQVWSSTLISLASIEAKIDLQDVEIAAIKAKTDNLPNDTANWLTTLRDKIDAIKAVVDGL